MLYEMSSWLEYFQLGTPQSLGVSKVQLKVFAVPRYGLWSCLDYRFLVLVLIRGSYYITIISHSDVFESVQIKLFC